MKYAVSAFLAIISCVVITNSAFAAYDFCTTSTGIALLTESPSAGSSAHLVDVNATNCSNLCNGTGGGKRAYIEFADKELYAAALSNNMTGSQYNFSSGTWSPRASVVVAWETGVTAKGSVLNGVTSCRLIAVRY